MSPEIKSFALSPMLVVVLPEAISAEIARDNPGTLPVGENFFVGNGGAGSEGSFKLDDGDITVTSWVAIARNGAADIPGMSEAAAGNLPTGVESFAPIIARR